MRFARKIALVLSITSILFGVFLAGLILYYYHHPSKIKGLVESSISASSGAICTIDELSYALTPLRLEAKGILLKPGENQQGFHLEIPAVTTEARLTGPFGHRTLTFEVFKISGFSIRADRQVALSTGRSEKVTPSFFGGVLGRLGGFLLFEQVRVETAQVGEGTFVFETAHQTVQLSAIRVNLTAGQPLEITFKARAAWPLKKMRFESPDVHIETDAALSVATPEVKGLLKIREAVIEGPDFGVKSAALDVRGSYDPLHRRLQFNPVDCRLEGARFRREADEASGKKIYLDLQWTADGFLDLNERRLDLSQFALDVKDVFQLAGGLSGGFESPQAISLKGFRGHVVPGQALRILSDWTGEKLPGFTSTAPVAFSGNVTGIPHQEKWQWQGDLAVDWSENRFAVTRKEMGVDGTVSGSVSVEGTFPDVGVTAELRVQDATFSGDGLTVKPCRAGLSVAGKYPSYKIHELTASTPEMDLTLGKKTLQIKDIEVDLGKGEVNVEKRSIDFPAGEFTSSLLKNLKLSVNVDVGQAIVSLKGRDVNLMPSLDALNVLPPDLSFTGDESLDLEALLHGEASCSIRGAVDLRNLSFQNPDSSYVGEGLVAAVRADAEIDLKGGRTTAKTRVSVDQGELLWDKFYADFGKNALSGVCEGAYDGTGETLQLSTVKLQMKDIVSLDGEGRVLVGGQARRVDLALRVEQTPLGPVFNVFLVEPFQAETPFLSSIEVHGSVSASLKLKGSQTDWTARGQCRWVDGALSSGGGGFSIEGVDLDFPVWLAASQGNSGQTASTGALAVRSMHVPFLPEQGVHISLDALPNQLVAVLSTHLKIPGGGLGVGPLVFRDMLTAERSIETSLTLDGVQLEPLVSGILAQPIQGIIEGKLAPVRLEGDTLRSEGQIRAEVLNGELFVSDIGVSGVFSPGPVFKMSARWNNLSLAELTSGTAFGKIEGVLQGHINGLEIAYGQPQAFDLLLETTKKQGVDQKISVKAVDNISQLGGGQSPFIGLAGTFAAIFKEFPYKKIGIRASLENDVFRIHGTIKEDGREYLVKRGGISGVNVVNQNPDNRVRFKDMVKRIKRVTAGQGGPVVK